MNIERQIALIDELRQMTAETEWVEFKHNNAEPHRIGRTISAISNVACIWGEVSGYVVWGIDNDSHDVIGTTFDPKKETHGGKQLELWLANALSPSPSFKFFPIDHPQGQLILLEIPAANSVPVKFNSIAYIRVGSTTPKLADYPDRESDLLSKLKPFVWEQGIAANFIDGQKVLELLDTDAFFKLLNIQAPETGTEILSRLSEERLIIKDVGGRWNITNLAAVTLSRRLSWFDGVERKALRVVQFAGDSRVTTTRDQEGAVGYAAGFSGALGYVEGLLPAEERIVAGIRTPTRVYPEIALRELIANALIHQDMTATGSGPLVEVFDNRIEISNPGIPVTDMPRKLFGAPPRSRNEHMARLMRRMGICEELGSGLVKLVTAVEEQKLPAPTINTTDGTTRLTLYGPRPFNALDRFERIWICYQHACLMWHRQKWLTNASLRDRFGLTANKAALVSRIIKDSLLAGWIKPADKERPKSGYLPYWG